MQGKVSNSGKKLAQIIERKTLQCFHICTFFDFIYWTK